MIKPSDKIVLNSLATVRKIEDEAIKALERTMRQLERDMTSLLDQGRQLAAADVALSRQQIEQVLMDSGYMETTGTLLNEGYQAAIDEAQQVYLETYGENFLFAETSLERLNAIKQLDLAQYAQLGDNFSTTMSRVMTNLQFGSLDFNEAVQEMRDMVDQLGNHAKTWVTTGLSGVYSDSSVMLAEDNGITEFIYVGPMDTLTRPFCREHLNQTKTKAQWDELDNNQILPVSVYRGGFNCRHQLVGVR